jgi:hypothetical protein
MSWQSWITTAVQWTLPHYIHQLRLITGILGELLSMIPGKFWDRPLKRKRWPRTYDTACFLLPLHDRMIHPWIDFSHLFDGPSNHPLPSPLTVQFLQTKTEMMPKCDSVVINQLTPWSRVLLEKLIVSQLVKKFQAVYKSRGFTRAHHRYLS